MTYCMWLRQSVVCGAEPPRLNKAQRLTFVLGGNQSSRVSSGQRAITGHINLPPTIAVLAPLQDEVLAFGIRMQAMTEAVSAEHDEVATCLTPIGVPLVEEIKTDAGHARTNDQGVMPGPPDEPCPPIELLRVLERQVKVVQYSPASVLFRPRAV